MAGDGDHDRLGVAEDAHEELAARADERARVRSMPAVISVRSKPADSLPGRPMMATARGLALGAVEGWWSSSMTRWLTTLTLPSSRRSTATPSSMV